MTSTPLTRTAQTLAVAAVLILTVPGLAFAVPSYATGDAAATAPDWPERFAAAHPYGKGVPYVGTSVVLDGRRVSRTTIPDGRSPDTLDAVASARQIGVVSTTGFDWTDAGIGAALGAGATIALSFGLLAWLFLRRRHQTPAI